MREWCFLLLPCFRLSRSGAMPLSLGHWVLVPRHVFPRSMAYERVSWVIVSCGAFVLIELRRTR